METLRFPKRRLKNSFFQKQATNTQIEILENYAPTYNNGGNLKFNTTIYINTVRSKVICSTKCIWESWILNSVWEMRWKKSILMINSKYIPIYVIGSQIIFAPQTAVIYIFNKNLFTFQKRKRKSPDTFLL